MGGGSVQRGDDTVHDRCLLMEISVMMSHAAKMSPNGNPKWITIGEPDW
jgi:hypothetical protein